MRSKVLSAVWVVLAVLVQIVGPADKNQVNIDALSIEENGQNTLSGIDGMFATCHFDKSIAAQNRSRERMRR